MGRPNFLISAVIAPFLFVAPFISAQATSVQVLPQSIESGAFEVMKGTGKVPVESRELQTRIELASCKTETLHISMLYDPASKLFWWNSDAVAAAEVRRQLAIPSLLPRDSVMCLTNSRFVLFWNGDFSGAHIFVRESREHYLSLDEGQAHVLRALHERPDFVWDYRRIDFSQLPKDFVFSKTESSIRIGPKLRAVEQIDAEWHITEDGPNGGSAIIVLNGQYEVVSTTVVPSK
jgi:hypothetical protein